MIARLKTSYQNGDLAFKFNCQNSPTHHEDQNGRSLKHCGLYHLLLYYYYYTTFLFQCSFGLVLWVINVLYRVTGYWPSWYLLILDEINYFQYVFRQKVVKTAHSCISCFCTFCWLCYFVNPFTSRNDDKLTFSWNIDNFPNKMVTRRKKNFHPRKLVYYGLKKISGKNDKKCRKVSTGKLVQQIKSKIFGVINIILI